jgi:hypothetical protein
MGKFTRARFTLPISFVVAFLTFANTQAFASPGCASLNGKKTNTAEVSGSAYGGWFDNGDTIKASASGTSSVGLYDNTNHKTIIPNIQEFTYVVPVTTTDTLVVMVQPSAGSYSVQWSCTGFCDTCN